jgi:hypothetical protein
MNQDVPIGSPTGAQIIPFPAGGRKAVSLARDTRPVADTRAPQAAITVSSGAWYHDAAIHDTKHAS